MKRICIYVTYDKYNVVDHYIGYMLGELRTCCEYLAVVCNNDVKLINGSDILKQYADDIFYRENRGFDVGGFKDALCSILDKRKILGYDELVLVNDSMFGPFRPMKEIFKEMEERKADFWGAAIHGEGESDFLGKITEHVQTYFMVIRSDLLHCNQFWEYWEKMPYCKTFKDAIRQHEMRFTSYFSKLGYCYSALADTQINDSVHNFTQYVYLSYELIKKRYFPFLKRQQIAYNTLKKQTQENLRLAIDYIDKETDYNVNLIWDNLIRTFNIADLQRSFHLQYIIPSHIHCTLGVAGENRIAVIIFIAYRTSAEYVLEYLQRLPNQVVICIASEYDEYLKGYRQKGFMCRKIHWKQRMELLIEFCDMDYLCVLHDADMTSDLQPSYIGKSYFYNIWENMIKNEKHVAGIIEQFVSESRLGFLTPPQANFAGYFGDYGREWDENFIPVKRIAERLHLTCQMSEEIPPFQIADNFWIRGHILEKVKDFQKRDFPYLPYLWSFFAQDAGYYSGIVESAEYASMNEVNMQYYLNQIAYQIRMQFGDFKLFSDMKNNITLKALQSFCINYSKLYIYGAGEMAQKYKNYVPGLIAYVISDNQKKVDNIEGIPVIYLSQMKRSEDCGVVLCLNKRNQQQVIPLLKKYGVYNYFCLQ
ncbi:hypothetical protein IMSAGC019_01745 [Lachnospiraceae bacterium]|nr:hypothetical protein IMSAGC019_01745 [Lachnospiraceae bacterium]